MLGKAPHPALAGIQAAVTSRSPKYPLALLHLCKNHISGFRYGFLKIQISLWTLWQKKKTFLFEVDLWKSAAESNLQNRCHKNLGSRRELVFPQ
ncbi:hypothetical protein FKM82_007165 [Ascaphus truei]